MARIRIGNEYILEGKKWEWVLSEIRVFKSGKREGQEYYKPLGYFPSLPSALKRILDQRLRDSDASTLQELSLELREVRTALTPLLEFHDG